MASNVVVDCQKEDGARVSVPPTEPIGGDEPTVAIRQSIGRYRVLSVVGRGGMGVVYAAYDPWLRRQVALKLVRGPERVEHELNLRLAREAQALARIRHPNVITVFDVGAHGTQSFFAMDLVDGQTAAAWLLERPRSVREIVNVFIAAGRGLAAAHAAGVVHRDFKPDNVIVARDGRVLVTDFGLARPFGVASDAPADDPPSLDPVVTQAGAIVGTPAYMAPEQMRHNAPDPRSDQFSFCVTLFEALDGLRPFSGTTVDDIEHSIVSGSRRRLERRDVPRAIERALSRGLSAERDARFPTMTALISALEPRRFLRREQVLAA
jgi:serine/threonine protein kinase